MAEQLTKLKLVLQGLGVDNDISTRDSRIKLQKLICLTQITGLKLGYGFSWYVRGPYSPSLTSDYYALANSPEEGVGLPEGLVLTEESTRKLETVRNLAQVPNVDLDEVGWLELLASVAFLRKSSRLSEESARTKISESKPTLAQFYDLATQKLKDAALVE